MQRVLGRGARPVNNNSTRILRNLGKGGWRGALAAFGAPLALSVLLAATAWRDFLWFHSLIEIVTIVIGVALFLIARETYGFCRNAYLLCVATGFFWSSLLDIPHTLSYEGMPGARGYSPNLPTTLWMGARSLQVAALLLATRYLDGRPFGRLPFPAFGAAATALAALSFADLTPPLFIPGYGLTPVKIAWEWLLILGLAAAFWLLLARGRQLDPGLRRTMLAVLALMAGMEICFTLYVRTYGLSNLVGHLLKLWAYWLMLAVVSRNMLRQPKRLLQEQAEMLSSVTATVPGMVFRMRRQDAGRYAFSFVSRGAAEIFELTPDELMADAGKAFARVLPEDMPALLAGIEQSASRLQPWRGEWRVHLPRGGLRWHDVESSFPQRDENGALVWTAYIHDVSADKEMELELTRHRDQLAQLVSERTEALQLALRRAEEADRAKSAFLSSMSHEIRTPLNAVIGMARLGLSDPAALPARRYFSQIGDAGEILLALVNDILDLAKLDSGKFAIEERPFRLATVIRRAAGMAGHQAALKGLRFAQDSDDGLPEALVGDELRLTQVLVNLLGNAVKFTDAGHVRLRVSYAGGGAGERVWLLFAVEDTGIGMDAAQLERLFEPFEQGDASTTRRFGGTGLGLSISKGIVERMGGSIAVASLPGHGSSFTVRLPLRVADPALLEDAVPDVQAGETRLSGVRILAAEDDPVNQEVLSGLLALEGADCRLCVDGEAALAALRAAGPGFDIFLTDIQMPGIDGYETARRASALFPALPIIGLTAYAGPEERAKCLAAGMRERVTKPIDIDVLVGVIRGLLAVPAREVPAAGAAAPQAAARFDLPALEQRLRKADFVGKVLAGTLEFHAGTPAVLRRLAAAGEAAELRRLAHSLRGVAANLAAAGVAESARRLEEDCAASGKIDATTVETLAAETEALLDDIRRYLEAVAREGA